MISIKYILENLDNVSNILKIKRNFFLDKELINILVKKKKYLREKKESLENIRNKNSIKKIVNNTNNKNIKIEIKNIKKELNLINHRLQDYLLTIPNIPSTNNLLKNSIEIKKKLLKNTFNNNKYINIDKKNDVIDFNTPIKISGNNFVILTGIYAKIHRILIQFMLDTHIKNHYKELYLPYLVNKTSLYGTGQFPKFYDEVFSINSKKNNYYLIPTSEVPITNMFRNSILNISDLPIKFVSHTPCFRNESLSYGKKNRGMIRQYQFEKVELVQFVEKNKSCYALEQLTKDCEKILELLNLSYRVVEIGSLDLGFSASKTYDIEVWMPSQKKYIEVSSCSNFKDFQTLRTNTKYVDNKKNKFFPHTINGSGLAVGRTFIALIENNTINNKFMIPKVLEKYF